MWLRKWKLSLPQAVECKLLRVWAHTVTNYGKSEWKIHLSLPQVSSFLKCTNNTTTSQGCYMEEIRSSRSEFLNRGILEIWGCIIPCWGWGCGYLVHCGMFSSIPGLPVDARTISPTLSPDNQKCLQTLPKVTWEAKLPPVENHRSKGLGIVVGIQQVFNNSCYDCLHPYLLLLPFQDVFSLTPSK